MVVFSRYTYWVGAMIVLAALIAVVGRAGALDPVQDVFLRVAGPAEEGLASVFEPVSGFFRDIGDMDRLREENRLLLSENERLRNENTALRADGDRLSELENLLGVVEADPSGERLVAGVLSRIQGPLTRELRIDRGANDGVSVGNPVLSAEGSLIGTVTKALPTSSFVRLLTDSRSRVAAQIRGSPADGVASGDGGGMTFELAGGSVNTGDTVVTSGLGGVYPADIPIGEVASVLGDPQDPFPTVRLQTTLRISTTRTVLVIVSFTPARFEVEE